MKNGSQSVLRMMLAVGISCLLVSSVQATLLFSEGFNYDSGLGISSVGSWSAGANSDALQIGTVNLTYPGLLDLGGNSLIISNGVVATSSVAPFANQNSGKVYYSLLFNSAGLNVGNNYFTALNPGTTAPNGSSDKIDMYYYTNGKIYLRANPQSATATTPVLNLNQTYLLVEMIDLDAKTASLWINPTPGGSEPTPDATLASLSATDIANVGFKAQSTTGSPTYIVDNLLVGTTWGDVTPAIPEPSTIALAAAGLGLMMTVIRRRRS